MSPGTVTAVAYLIAELAAAGVSISEILRQSKGTGKVPADQWAQIMAEVKAAEDLWESA